MSWDLYILDGAPADLAPARAAALAPLDPAPAREVLDLEGTDGVWTGDTLVAELFLATDQLGIVRSLAASLHFDETTSPEMLIRQRVEYADVLDVLVSLARRMNARLYDPQREKFITPADIPTIAGSLD